MPGHVICSNNHNDEQNGIADIENCQVEAIRGYGTFIDKIEYLNQIIKLLKSKNQPLRIPKNIPCNQSQF